MSLPLDGILVVSMEQAVAGPFCSNRLKQSGARVIKIERKDGGDFARGYDTCLLYTSPSPRDRSSSRMPSSA